VKLAIIGAASSYTPELIDGLFSWLHKIPVSDVWMMDPNLDRLAVTSNFARRMAAANGKPFEIHHTDKLAKAVEGAAFVVTQIRVGGIQARIADEKLGLRHGIIGQETTGVGGFACALRTIPPILKVAREMEKRAPKAVLVNFTNPSGIVTEALIKHSKIKSVGLCNVPIGMIMDIVKHTGCRMEDVDLDYVGLNHLAWIRRFKCAGRDITAQALAKFWELAAEEWQVEKVRENMLLAMRSLNMLCNPYLQYFYATQPVLDHLKKKKKTRGEEVLQVEKALFAKYAQPNRTAKPEELSKRGGAHYSTAAFHLIGAMHNNTGNRQIVCCRNAGAIPSFDADVSVEIPAIINKRGATSLPQPVPEPAIHGLMQVVKAYESLTVEAAVTGNRKKAFQAMLTHPLMPGATGCMALLDELLDINRPYVNPKLFKT
jgi:6-phospho-beta-glucosidase